LRRLRKVIVECNPDEILVLTLGLSRQEVVHQNSKGEVCNYHAKNDIRIAIIDEDPGSGQPRYLQEFIMEEEKFGIMKLVNNNTEKIIIVIKPRLEEWIIAQCLQSNVNPEKFFLPKEAKRLKDVINLRLNHFRDLLNELKNKQNNGMEFLQSFFK
jgi:hypothetical protein